MCAAAQVVTGLPARHEAKTSCRLHWAFAVLHFHSAAMQSMNLRAQVFSRNEHFLYNLIFGNPYCHSAKYFLSPQTCTLNVQYSDRDEEVGASLVI